MSAYRFHALGRRGFLAGAGSALGLSALGRPAFAQAPLLTVASRQIEVKKKAAKVFGVMGPGGKPGLLAQEGDSMRGGVLNATSEPFALHWHGQIFAAPDQDRARPGGGEMAAGQTDTYDYRLTPGTHWMHSHQLNEQQLLAAPMVTREKDAGDAQDVVIMLHDFSFRSPAEILAKLGGANGHHHGSGGHASGGMKHDSMNHDSMNHGGMGSGMGGGMMGGGMNHGAMHSHGNGNIHANDVDYDAYLANDRTFDDPEIARVERGGRVRLRIINGATATAFFIDTGALEATCVAVDGSGCAPFKGRLFPLAQGQRIDLLAQMPAEGGAFPIVAQMEAGRRRTGIVLATPGAQVKRIEDVAGKAAGHADLSLDMKLAALQPLAQRPADRMAHVMLGEEPNYRWTINGAVHGEGRPITARVGERLEIMFMNPTSMMHPMHLHGHHFQVVGVGGRRFSGPMRDTVIVPPHLPVLVAVDLDKAGGWFLHCHHLYHMATGMMTEVRVS